ncbi:MAG TPA: hypothetical protein VFG79_18275 [Solirubrobacter sp.]|nr:hypothetical protein [Solirubrobacter sp.]
MIRRPAAGQASIEYVAALALVAATLAVAAPAVGAPDLAGIVAHKLRLALCLVAGDVCSDRAAKEAGLAACPLSSDVKGHEASVTAYSIEVGHRWTLTVTPRSDGSVGVVRVGSGSIGATGGWSTGFALGPVRFEAGATGAARGRVHGALGWEFRDRAAAGRFLDHALLNTFNLRDFPATWESVEQGGELSGMVGVALGGEQYRERGDLVGADAAAASAIGGRIGRGGVVTLYGRAALDAPELTLPFMPPRGGGHDEWVGEYTLGRDGPRELAFRTADANGDRVTETVARLDLRDPETLAAARPLRHSPFPWHADRVRAVLRRIDTHGTVERAVSTVDDRSVGASGHVAGGIKFGAGGRLIKIHRTLVEATARTGGRERERFDCQRR